MYDFLGVISVSNIDPCCFKRMNTRRKIGQKREGATVGGNQGPPKAPTEGVAMPVNPAGFTDAELRESLA